MVRTVPDIASSAQASGLQQTRDNLEYQVKSIGRYMGIRKRDVLQRLLDESSKYEGKNMDKVKLLLDLVAELVSAQPKIESVSLLFYPCLEQRGTKVVFRSPPEIWTPSPSLSFSISA